MSETKPKVGIADRASTGIVWTFFQFASTKLVSLIGQIILAWLLVPDDFGYVGLAYTVMEFAAILQKFGLRDVLVQRGRSIRIWENSAFWLSAMLGIVAAAMMVVAAPLAATFYDEPKLLGLILVLALATGIESLSSVPAAVVQSRMQFRTLAVSNGVAAILGVVLSVILARLGFGAYSIILPRPVVILVRTVWLFQAAKPKIRRRWDTRLWKYLIGSSTVLLLTYFLVTITGYADYIILGKLYAAELVGLYYFAFNLSMQSFGLLAVNVSSVLFPALTQLRRDPQRQVDAFERAIRTLAAIGMPICAIQAAVADPLIHILFDAKWYPAIPLLQILSLGIGFRIVVLPSTSLLKSQGRFWTLLIFFAAAACVFVSAVWLGAVYYKAIGAAVAVAIYSIGLGFAILCVSMWHARNCLGRAFRVYATPCLASVLTVGAAYAISTAIPNVTAQHWLRLFVVGLVSVALYVPCLRFAMPETYRELEKRWAALRKR